MERVKIWEQDDGEAPLLRPLVGLRVVGAWVIPPGDMLFVRLEGGKIFQAWAVLDEEGSFGVAFKVGEEAPNTKWRFLETLPQVNKEPMAGKRFDGMDGRVVVFVADDGVRFGARILLDDVEWVKAAPPN